MTDPEIGRWMSVVFSEIFEYGDALFRARQMGNMKGFRKAMRSMRDTLSDKLGDETPAKRTCEHCGNAKATRGKLVCQDEKGPKWMMNVGAADTCRRFTPRGKE